VLFEIIYHCLFRCALLYAFLGFFWVEVVCNVYTWIREKGCVEEVIMVE
jgi:hypothetical protein